MFSMKNSAFQVIKETKQTMDNVDFLKEARIWFFGTILGTIFSAIGIIAESKTFSIIGLLLTAGVTMYYAYQCWQAGQWHEE